ncbi:MAG: 50S ribosomal protein L6 [Clostridiales bacterium]|nr:50S ribosomal protein L6 [Clostridiales bacterium]
MSRIGRKHIDIPAGVEVKFEDGVVTVKGKNGELKQAIKCSDINVKIDGGVINVERANEQKQTRAYHGLYRQLIADMVSGVVTPFTKTLIVAGVGYKCAVTGNKLVMNIGYSKPVEYVIPEGITITCPDPLTIVVSGISKEHVGEVAAQIKSKRPVEPYHGYGLHYSTEVVLRKEAKTAGKK